jgi:hypothetical protein
MHLPTLPTILTQIKIEEITVLEAVLVETNSYSRSRDGSIHQSRRAYGRVRAISQARIRHDRYFNLERLTSDTQSLNISSNIPKRKLVKVNSSPGLKKNHKGLKYSNSSNRIMQNNIDSTETPVKTGGTGSGRETCANLPSKPQSKLTTN